jgi:hypothetical protein
MTVTGIGPGRTTLDHQDGPIAVMLDLMNPISTLGRLLGEARKLWRDKAMSGNAGHASYLANLSEITNRVVREVTPRRRDGQGGTGSTSSATSGEEIKKPRPVVRVAKWRVSSSAAIRTGKAAPLL